MPNRWFPYRKANPLAKIRLFCFPYAGGAASHFTKWGEELPGDVEVCAVQLPGRENRLSEQQFTNLQPVLNALLQEFDPLLDLPFAFFGHSLGALIAFEFARVLRNRKNISPALLMISGRRAPQLSTLEQPLHQLPDTEMIAGLRDYEGTPEEILQNPELMEFFLQILRNDLAITETYRYIPEEPLTTPISCYGGWQDKLVSREQLLAWCEHTRGVFKLQMFKGNHFYLRDCNLLLKAIALDLTFLTQSWKET